VGLICDFAGALAPHECDALIAAGQAGGMASGQVWRAGGYTVDPTQRAVVTCYLPRGGEQGWLYPKLDALFAEAGAQLGLPVAPLSEDVQLMRYDEGGHFGLWHSDAGGDLGAARTVSASFELSALEDYEGGVLEIVPDTIGRLRSLPRGGARFFPSRALHRVTPVTRGTRWSLVAWTGAA
jgi:PKHD-type hydroxylase